MTACIRISCARKRYLLNINIQYGSQIIKKKCCNKFFWLFHIISPPFVEYDFSPWESMIDKLIESASQWDVQEIRKSKICVCVILELIIINLLNKEINLFFPLKFIYYEISFFLSIRSGVLYWISYLPGK